MIDLTPASWGDLLAQRDGKFNPSGVQWTAPEKPQLLLRHDPKAFKFVSDAVAQVRKEQRWNLK